MPFAVFVAFVRRDENRRARLFEIPERLQQMQRAHGVDVKCFARARVGFPDQRLGRQVKNKIRFALADRLAQNVRLLNVADDMAQAAGQTEFGKKRRLGVAAAGSGR